MTLISDITYTHIDFTIRSILHKLEISREWIKKKPSYTPTTFLEAIISLLGTVRSSCMSVSICAIDFAIVSAHLQGV